jgi:galacturan 1,4-alpha-galacturonidase
MSFAITNSSNVVVKNWSVIQPQFWASIVINSTDVLYKDYYVNATQYNPEAMKIPLNWLQNTDGCDTFRSHNVTFGKLNYLIPLTRQKTWYTKEEMIVLLLNRIHQ